MRIETEAMDKLKNAIISNPDLKLRFFVGEDCNCGDFRYEENYINDVIVEGLVLYEGKYYNEEDFGEKLFEELEWEFETKEKLNKHIDTIIETENFEKTIFKNGIFCDRSFNH